MFSPFKPFKSLFGSDEVTTILEKLGVPGTSDSFAQRLTQSQRQNDELSLTIDLPADLQEHLSYLEQFLAEKLKPAGIRTVHLSIANPTISNQSTDHKAPVVQQSQSTETAQGYAHTQHYQNAYGSGSQTQSGTSGRASQSQMMLPPVQDASQTMSQSLGGMSQSQGEQGQWQHMAPMASNSAAVTSVEPSATQSARPAPPRQHELKAHPHIRNIIAVASGKGGVGKSTTTVNLALALKAAGARVGVLDADIYGPSIPTMLGIEGQHPDVENDRFVPLAAHGLAVLSIGNLLGDDQTPVAWRGPKATGALMQLFNETLWPELDYLVIDLPPGTGDIQLTLAQRIPVTGAVIVTTPQHVALMDAQKGIELFNKVNITVLGVVENMATHLCSQCGHADDIFGTGGGETLSQRYAVPLLGRLPLDARIREQADSGQPSVAVQDAMAPRYQQIALKVIEQVARLPQQHQRDNKRIF